MPSRAHRTPLVAAALWLWAASAAGAPVPFSGTLSIDLTAGTPVSVSGSGVADVTLSGSSVTALALPAGVFAGVATIPLTPSASPAVALRASLSNPTLLLSAGRPPCDVATPALGCLGSGPLHGRAGLLGLLRIGLLGTPASPLASLTLLAAPVGGAGSAVASNTVVAASARLVGAGWTTGPALAFATHAGGVVGTFARTGTANSAHIQVVTPFAVTTSVGPGSQPGFAILDLVFVPEPSVPVLLGAGVALALGLGARAERRHG